MHAREHNNNTLPQKGEPCAMCIYLVLYDPFYLVGYVGRDGSTIPINLISNALTLKKSRRRERDINILDVSSSVWPPICICCISTTTRTSRIENVCRYICGGLNLDITKDIASRLTFPGPCLSNSDNSRSNVILILLVVVK